MDDFGELHHRDECGIAFIQRRFEVDIKQMWRYERNRYWRATHEGRPYYEEQEDEQSDQGAEMDDGERGGANMAPNVIAASEVLVQVQK